MNKNIVYDWIINRFFTKLLFAYEYCYQFAVIQVFKRHRIRRVGRKTLHAQWLDTVLHQSSRRRRNAFLDIRSALINQPGWNEWVSEWVEFNAPPDTQYRSFRRRKPGWKNSARQMHCIAGTDHQAPTATYMAGNQHRRPSRHIGPSSSPIRRRIRVRKIREFIPSVFPFRFLSFPFPYFTSIQFLPCPSRPFVPTCFPSFWLNQAAETV